MNKETYDRQFQEIQTQKDDRFPVLESNQNPILNDDTPNTTDFNFDYTMHCAWASRVLAETKPESHADFGSWIHFAVHASAFQPNFTFYDIRPAQIPLSGLTCKKEDLTTLSTIGDNSLSSVSCMHTLEHVGLGRYGDPIMRDGDLRAARQLVRIIKPGGQLIFVSPMNRKPRVMFNAHRYYDYRMVLSMFEGLKLKDFLTIDRTLGMISGANPDSVTDVPGPHNFDTTGCFWFIKE